MALKMEPPFSLDILLRRYGKRRGNVETVYKRMFAEAMRLATPRSLQDTFPAAELPRLAANLPGAETITLGLCSIGPDLEARVSALFNEAPVSAVVLDEIGTHWVKVLGREMHQEIRAAAHAIHLTVPESVAGRLNYRMRFLPGCRPPR
jgi:hypothetical protein